MISLILSLTSLLLLASRQFKTALSLNSSFLLTLAAVPLLVNKTPISPIFFSDILATPLILLTLWLLPLMILASPEKNTKNYTIFLLTLVSLSITLIVAFAAP